MSQYLTPGTYACFCDTQKSRREVVQIDYLVDGLCRSCAPSRAVYAFVTTLAGVSIDQGIYVDDLRPATREEVTVAQLGSFP